MLLLVIILVAIPFFMVLSLAKKVDRLQGELDFFRSRASEDAIELYRRIDALRGGVPAAEPVAAEPEPEPVAAAPAPLAETPETEPDIEAPPHAPKPEIQEPPEPEPVPQPEPEPEPEVAIAAFSAEPAPSPGGGQDARTTPPVPPPPGGGRDARTTPPFDFESLVGVKLFSWIAGIALVLAAVFFLRYSIDHGWVTPPIRMAMGFITGVGLIALSSLRFGRSYPITANALDGAGVAILFATTYASHALWDLIPFTVAFVMMAIVTVVAVLLSIRRDSLFIALLGMLGGFATPAILSSGENRPVALFSYLLLLNAGLAWTAYRRRWPVLLAASVVFTVLYQLFWAGRFLDGAQLPLASAIFLAFPILFTVFQLAKGSDDGEPSRLFRITTAFAGIVPLAFAVYTAAVPAIGARYNVLFAFLLLAVAGFAFLSVRVARDTVTGGLPAVATLVVFAVWLARGWTPAAWPAILAWLALFVLLFAFGPLLLRKLGENGMIERSTLVAGALLFAIPALIVREPATKAPALIFLTGAALLVAVAVSSFRTGRQGDYMTGALAMLVAQAFWSFRYISTETSRAAMLLYGGFALLMLAIAAIGRALKKADTTPASPWLLFGTLLLAFFLVAEQVPFAGFAILALFLIAAFAAEGIRKGSVILFGLGAAGTLVLLLGWMLATGCPGGPAPLLAVASLMALGVLAASALGRKRHGAEWRGLDFGDSSYLALGAYAFLLVAVVDPRVDASPAVLLAGLGIAVFASALGALHLRRPSLHLASILGAFVVLTAWILASWIATPVTAPALAACAVAAFAIAWIFAARRVLGRGHAAVPLGGAPVAQWTIAAIVALVALQAVTMIGAEAEMHLPFGAIAAILIAAPVAIALIAAAAGWHSVAMLAVATSAVTAVLFRGFHDAERTTPLAFAVIAAHYLIFTLYGFLLARRAGRDSAPSYVAIAATVPFFFFARDAMNDWGWGGYIGVLPVAIALVLLALLRRTIALERETAEENIGRRALVAGSALAFVTAAIPLQLEKEWITIGWALEAAALAWLFGKIRHRGLLAWSAGLFAVVFARLVLNPAVLEYHPRAETAILNWYFYTYAVTAAAFYAGALVVARASRPPLDGALGVARASRPPLFKGGSAEPEAGETPAPHGLLERKLPKALASGGTVLLFLLLNIEIADFYSTGATLTFDFFRAGLAQELTYTLGWALFAIGMLVAGIAGASRSARIAAITLLSLTVFKAFLYDLGRLGGLYRIGSFVGLAISLALVAVLLQKFALRGGGSRGGGVPPTPGGAHP